MDTAMRYVNVVADLCAIPDSLSKAVLRFVAIVSLVFVVVVLDKYLNTAAPAMMFGYALGGLTVYGTMRKRVKAFWDAHRRCSKMVDLRFPGSVEIDLS